ncbi:MAG: hypothetical protein QY326_07945 [Bdellovibrionota bacterium]|nr:MAG: hypothetical protein QY326_07945 [Bdellovibrionota bacterium]
MQPEEGSGHAVAKCGLRHKHVLSASSDSAVFYLVHGRAGTVDVMWTFRRVIPEHAHIIAVEAPIPDPLGGFSWWLADDPEWRNVATDSLNMLVHFIEEAEALYGIRPRYRVALGFSQGGGLLSLLLEKGDPPLSALGLLASFVIEGHKYSGPHPPVFIAHGTQDEAVRIERARAGAAFLRSQGFAVTMVEDAVGHKVGSSAMRLLKGWLADPNNAIALR